MRIKFIILIMMCFAAICKAQTITILSCVPTVHDNIALSNPRYDLNHDLSAAIIINAKSDSLTFTGNIVGDIVTKDNQYILYVVDGTKKINVYCPGVLPTELNFTIFPDLHKGLEGGRTYELELSIPTSQSLVSENPKGSNILVFKANQPLECIIVNGEEWKVKGNSAKRMMPYGKYEYTATSKSSQKVSGVVEVGNTLGNTIVRINF